MTYAMTLDNSWELMTEEEMYDVNGGGTTEIVVTFLTDAAFKGAIGLGAVAFATALYAKVAVLLAPLHAIPVVGTVAYWSLLGSFVAAATYAFTKGVNIVLNIAFWSFRNKTHNFTFTL